MLHRIGAIGDIHAEDQALERVLSFLGDQSLDKILAVGDIVDGSGDANRCCELLAGADDYGYALEANHALQELIRAEKCRIVINGHTHQRMVRAFDGLTIVNVGTLHRDHDPCFAIIDFDDHMATFFESPHEGEITQALRLPI